MSLYGVSSSSSSSASGIAQLLAQMREAKQGGEAEDFASTLIADHDTDGDGLLNSSEIGLDEDIFSAIDTDGDGALSAEEITAEEERRKTQGAFNAAMAGYSVNSTSGTTADNLAATLLSALDTDTDGLLSSEESGLDDESFSALDSDGDGTLSTEELTAALEDVVTQMQDAAMNMTASQTTETEESATSTQAAGGSGGAGGSDDSEEEYDALDLNEDGVVSADELRQAMQSGLLSGDFMSASMEGSSRMRTLAANAYQSQSMAGMWDTTAMAGQTGIEL